MEEKNGKCEIATLFIAGSLLGAGIALLIAPQSGKKTRRKILYFGKRVKSHSQKIQVELQRSIDDLVEDISEKLDESIHRGRDWTDKTVQGIQQVLGSGKEFIQKEIDKVMNA